MEEEPDYKEELFQQENDNDTLDTQVKGTLLDHMEISITECEKRETGALNYRDFYTVYLIETKVTDTEWKGALCRLSTIWRRYSEFESFRNYLIATYPYLVIAPLPEKKFDTIDRGGDKRRGGLETFLLRCASHKLLSGDKLFMSFLQQDEGWKETIKEAGYLQLAETKLKSLGTRLKSPDKEFESFKNYGVELGRNIGNLMRVRGKLSERSYSVHKLHANYGRIMSEWSSHEEAMGDTLQKAGHFLDSLAASIDTPLEEEEIFADQLKEYFYLSDSLVNVCQNHEAIQTSLERTQSQIVSYQGQRENVYKGRSSLVSRLFGGIDTDETKEQKCRALDQKIEQTNLEMDETERNLGEFSKLAKEDIALFHQQKVIDLRETLAGYVLLQAKMCRKDVQTWKNIRDCFQTIP